MAVTTLVLPPNVTLTSVQLESFSGTGDVEVVSSGAFAPPAGRLVVAAGDLPERTRAAILALPFTGATSVETDLGLYFLVKGIAPGTWRSDYVRLGYIADGRPGEQLMRLTYGICVGPQVGECDPGLPSWWD